MGYASAVPCSPKAFAPVAISEFQDAAAMAGAGSEIELGGFRGRTNKLVDGCYSWWVGGCFALLSSLGIVGAHGRDDNHESSTAHQEDEAWDDIDGLLTAVVA